MRKPRRKVSQNVILNLSPDKLREVIRWLVANEPYVSVQEKMAAQLGVEVSIQTISVFWRKYVAPEVNSQEEFIRRTVREEWLERLRVPKAAAGGPVQTQRISQESQP